MKKTAGRIRRPRAIRNNHAPPKPSRTIEYAAGRLINVVSITVPVEIRMLFRKKLSKSYPAAPIAFL